MQDFQEEMESSSFHVKAKGQQADTYRCDSYRGQAVAHEHKQQP